MLNLFVNYVAGVVAAGSNNLSMVSGKIEQ